MSENATKAFAYAAMGADGLAVSREDGAIFVTCADHDGQDTIQLSRVFALAVEHGLNVVDGEAHLDTQDVTLVVSEDAWHSGQRDGGQADG